jgi:hypothetical protein
MRLGEVRTLLGCDLLCGGPGADEHELTGGFAADLMSDVLAFATEGSLLITGLTSAQVVHTADVADLRAILFACDKRPAPAVLAMAVELGLPILTTRRTLFDACGVLWAAGLSSGRR